MKAVETKTEMTKKSGRTLDGVIVSTKMQKTVVVEVKRYVKHPKYKKYLTQTKRYLAHDETGAHKEGEKVTIVETRPMSKRKSFIIRPHSS
ncbi:MAG: 30S ribosomal protein S17 [Patescibacteria group bacterium]